MKKFIVNDSEQLPKISKDTRLGSPVARPSKIICIGLNYADHAKETGADRIELYTERYAKEFKEWNIGTVTLPEGVHKLIIDAESKPDMGVMNLKNVVLVPVKK